MNTTPPPTREERLERALREIVGYSMSQFATMNDMAQHMGEVARLALQPAADGEETKP